MAAAADVPGKYDLVINDGTNTTGFIFDRTQDARATYTSTATFVERQNISNAYGDNSQDFFLTARNRDWSGGEQQKFFRPGQDGGRYWMGSNVDVSIPGQVTLSPATITSSALAEAVVTGARAITSNIATYVAGTTTMFLVAGDGASSSIGAHGLGAKPSHFGMTADGLVAYMSTTSAGTVGVRKYDGAFSTFSATACDALAFVNNTLYGLKGFNTGAPALLQYDTAGTATTLFSWKAGDGTTSKFAPVPSKIEAYGGKLLILLSLGQENGAELWIYDGSGASRLEVFPSNFYAYDMEVLYGVVYISGVFMKAATSSTIYTRPAIHFFDGSNIGLLWQASAFNTSAVAAVVHPGPFPALTMYQGGLIFTDDTTGNMMLYSPARGGVSTIGTYTVSGDSPRLITPGSTIVHTRNATTYRFFPDATYPSSGYVISSLIDFESSLNKIFRGVKVEFDAATDGNGGTVDIAYQVDSVSGSWTTLQTTAVSGTEYTFTSVSGHAIAIKVTLNKGTSTAGPTLKSTNLRAAPTTSPYELRQYNLDLTSTADKPTVLVDGTTHPLTGFEQAVKLRTAIRSTGTLTLTDKFGTITAVSRPQDSFINELHSNGTDAAKPGQFVARFTAREI